MLSKKGQGAMEYLMTYGWAILVVMIVGVVLWQLGIFGGGPGAANTARGFGRVKVMEPSIKYTQAGVLTFTIMNGAGQSISDLDIWADGSGCDGTTDNITETETLDTAVGAGSTLAVTVDCVEAKSGGDSFAVDLDIAYSMTVAGTLVNHLESGTIRGAAEPT